MNERRQIMSKPIYVIGLQQQQYKVRCNKHKSLRFYWLGGKTRRLACNKHPGQQTNEQTRRDAHKRCNASFTRQWKSRACKAPSLIVPTPTPMMLWQNLSKSKKRGIAAVAAEISLKSVKRREQTPSETRLLCPNLLFLMSDHFSYTLTTTTTAMAMTMRKYLRWCDRWEEEASRRRFQPQKKTAGASKIADI